MASNRIGTVRNLEDGGTYDLLVMGFANGFPRGFVSFEIGDTPRRVTGVQKVVQTFLRVLLTSKGSDPVFPTLGTQLNEYIAFSNIGADVQETNRAVTDAIKDAEQQTRAILTSSGNDLASQLQSVGIIYIEVTGESVNIGVEILTNAGTQASIAVPFPQTDLPLNA